MWLLLNPSRWLAALGLVCIWLVAIEVQTSWLQSRLLAAVGRRISYTPGAGPSPSVRYPTNGPHDVRLGYTRQPQFVHRLQGQGFMVAHQARWSPTAEAVVDGGLFPIYAEKSQAGLQVLDRSDRPLYVVRHPGRIYTRFADIPPVIVESLLFAENRELLQTRMARRNPAIEYPRLANAVLDVTRRLLDPGHPMSGGSTLATQLEKVRHSPEGRTSSMIEKGRQMLSASLRAYRQGEETLAARHLIVRDYVNALPLGAIAGHGEVVGLADGLWAWYGADVDEVNRLLAGGAGGGAGDPTLAERARAYRQALSLLLAARQPTTYLLSVPGALEGRVDSYLRLLAQAGIISPALRDAALATRLQVRARVPLSQPDFAERKGVDGVRLELASRLGLSGTYDLDRLDVVVRTTLDGPGSAEVSRVLSDVANPASARKAGLTESRLLGTSRPEKVIYSLTLYERGDEGNLLRVQADNHGQPLNITEGTRLELGSTAKLRTLVSYLEVIEQLHAQYAGLSDDALRAVQPRGRLRAWAVAYLTRAGDRSLAPMIDAALARRYSASPAESFFTGGGVHRFNNFDSRHDGTTLTVRQALRDSVNLVFIRLMRDLVAHYTFENPEWAGVLLDPAHPARPGYLARFADREGREFLRRFHRQHGASSPAEAIDTLGRRAAGSPARLAAILRTVRPEAPVEGLEAFLLAHAKSGTLNASRVQALFDESDPARWSWQDLGHLARVHPLELWLVRFLHQRPGASLPEAIEASAAERQDAYQWLFRTSNARARQRVIATLVEEGAFGRIHASWRRQGYPFASLVPSYATAIGSSGDNPAALSELMGIIQNDGLRLPTVRIAEVQFGAGTPYDTRLTRMLPAGERVLTSAVATVLRRELVAVVEHGTGRRLAGGVEQADGRVLPIGGKTGTGDNRFITNGPDGRRSRVVNRTATFAFTIGDRHFGTIVAYVPGGEAARYDFTSALPVQLLKEMLPVLTPLLES
ncbi:MAG: transglycosylase domain-containing protein [Acidobacteria bacterium]|nr:transglycosylase domain-containing protein [Acidobacteriota bacterium]